MARPLPLTRRRVRMTRWSISGWVAVACIAVVGTVTSQVRDLSILRAVPVGDLAQAEDARDVRVTFSEPMVAIGAPATERPAWFSIVPATAGTFHWSGTSTFVFTPASASGFPNATRFTVTVDSTASALSGRHLFAPYALSFT